MFGKLFRRVSLILAALALLLCGAAPLPGGGGAAGGQASVLAAAGAGGELYFTILHTNDEHSSVIPHSPAVDYHPVLENPAVGGYARLAAAVNGIRERKEAAGEPVLLLNAGDYLGGSPFSWLAPRGLAPELAIMQEIGYDAVAVGNHEYDYGTAVLAAYLQAAGYPGAHAQTAVLAANSTAPPGHPLNDLGLFRETHLVELENGITVGLFALIGKDAISVTNSPEPVEFADQHETARVAVESLRARGADVIVALTHSGVEEDSALALDVPGIDVIVGGHCHTALHEPVVENGTIIVQTGALLHHLGVLELAYDPAAGTVRARNAESGQPFLEPVDSRYEADPRIEELVENYMVELNALVFEQTGGRVHHILDTLARCDFPVPDTPPLQESPFGNFVTDAMRLVTWEKTGERVDLAVQANGSIRGGITPGTMAHSLGQVSFYDLADLVGLGIGPDGYAGYPIVSFYLTGEEVRRVLDVAVLLAELMGNTYYLQFSGLRYDFNPADAVLFTVPVIDQPIPAALAGGSAVKKAELYLGEGVQGTGGDGYVPLERGDEKLYRIVSDRYLISFLPLIGEMLPNLTVELKDKGGNPVPQERFDDFIVTVDGKELKVWQTVVEYAMSRPLNAAGIPQIEAYYAATAGRINPVRTIPLITWPVLILLALAAGIVLLIRSRRRRKIQAGTVLT